MNLIGRVLLNCIVALHRWLSKVQDSDSIIPPASPWEPPHHLQLVLRDPYHNGFLHANVVTYQTPPPPLGRESGTETQDYPTVIAVPHRRTYIPKHHTRRVFSYSYGSLKQHNNTTHWQLFTKTTQWERQRYIPTYVTTSVATAVCAMK